MDLVDVLMAEPGLYVGPQNEVGSARHHAVARVLVGVLPGRCGVTLDYDVLPVEGGRTHHEHALLARTPGGLVLVTAHDHAEVATVLHEAEPGWFTAGPGEAPFPSAIRLEVPEPGHLVYSWSYGWADEPLRLREVGDVWLLR